MTAALMEAPVTAANSTPTQPAPVPLHPAIDPSVQLGFTVLYSALYAALFVVVYAQLWLLYLYRHKRWSYQSVFLFLCLLWAALRTTLFSFYFVNAREANHLPFAAYWLLYCFPVCLQFFTLSLINMYLTQVLVKVRESSRTTGRMKRWLACCVFGAVSFIFLSVNMVCAALGDRGRSGSGERTWNLVLVRVILNDSLFILDAVLLAALLLLLTRHSHSTSPYLVSKERELKVRDATCNFTSRCRHILRTAPLQGTTVCRTAALGAAVILLFTSRACYNLTVLLLSQKQQVEAFDYDWYNVSDQADLRVEMGDSGYLVFGAILFIWELLPTSLLILIFRVRQPSQETNPAVMNSRVLPRPYFFDDPQGSDDDTPVPWARSPHSHPQSSWNGAESAPLLFASKPPDHNHQHHSFYSTPQN